MRAMLKMTEDKAFIRFCQQIARRMVTGLFQDQGRTWREAARLNGKGRELYAALKKELQGRRGQRMMDLIDNTSYRIITLPTDIGHDVAEYVAREATKGRRASDIEAEIQAMFPERTTARAKLIARTQVSMTQTDLIRSRAEDLGINWYSWRAVGGYGGDGRTRTAHRKMDGVLVNWNNPPNPERMFPTIGKDGRPYKAPAQPYHAGQIFNCRCYPEPVIDLDLISWPARVYIGGGIVRMTRKQFEKVM
jgi:uncharacterized protein with gpF-like domain